MEEDGPEPRASEQKEEDVRVGAERVGADTAAPGGDTDLRQSQRVPDTPITHAKPIKFTSALCQLPSNEVSKRLPVWKVSVSITGQVSAGTREADHTGVEVLTAAAGAHWHISESLPTGRMIRTLLPRDKECRSPAPRRAGLYIAA